MNAIQFYGNNYNVNLNHKVSSPNFKASYNIETAKKACSAGRQQILDAVTKLNGLKDECILAQKAWELKAITAKGEELIDAKVKIARFKERIDEINKLLEGVNV